MTDSPTLNTWLEYGILATVVGALIVLALFLPPISLQIADSNYQPLASSISQDNLTLYSAQDTNLTVRMTTIDPNHTRENCILIATLPSYLAPISAYSIQTRGIPPDTIHLEWQPTTDETLDWYGFDPALTRWRFIPIQPDSDIIRAEVSRLPLCLVMARPQQKPPVYGITIDNQEHLEPDMVPSGAQLYSGGLYPAPDGSLVGALSGTVQTGERYHALPLISNAISDFVTDVVTVETILGNTALRQRHVTHLVNFAASDDYHGLAIDYRDLPEALRHHFSHFVLDLGRGLHAQEQILVVFIDSTSGVYDWEKLGYFADEIVVRAPLDPTTDITATLHQMTQQINRYQLLVGISANSIEVFEAGISAPLSFDEAVSTIGEVIIGDTSYAPGETVTATRSYEIGWHSDTHTTFLQSGQNIRWLASASSLRHRMEQFQQLGGIVLFDLFAAEPGIRQILTRLPQQDIETGQARWIIATADEAILAESEETVFTYEIPSGYQELDIMTQLLIDGEWLTLDRQTLSVR